MRQILLLLVCTIFIMSARSGAQPVVGLLQNSHSAYNGYTVFSGYSGDTVYMIDNCGKLLHKWACSQRSLRNPVYVMPNGDVMCAGKVSADFASAAGLLERVDWQGNVVWSYTIADSMQAAHHGFVPMPNGNVLAVVWERISVGDQILAGRDPANIAGELWSEKILEISGGPMPKVVWEWRLWDHLIQEFDASKNNYGSVRDHPERLDVNVLPGLTGSWAHVNSIDYNPMLDQILLCSRNFSEIFIIDHSTTTAEAATGMGGARNKGGDFLYRWGNPLNYRRGSSVDQKLFRPHDGHWARQGILGDLSKIIVFNNGETRPGGKYSTVDILTAPLQPDQSYHLGNDSAYLPQALVWQYPPTPDPNFFSSTQGSAQVLPNGNVLIAESNSGEFFEVDTQGKMVWQYMSPVNPDGIITQGNVVGDNSVFMIRRYPVSYSAFAGRNLTPGAPIEINPLPYNCSLALEVGTTETPAFSFAAYPNPASEKIYVHVTTSRPETVSLRMMDISGRVVWHTTVQSGQDQLAIPLTGFPVGLYVLEAGGNSQKVQAKVVVQ